MKRGAYAMNMMGAEWTEWQKRRRSRDAAPE